MALAIGLFLFSVALVGALVGRDALGWGIGVSVWTNMAKSLAPIAKGYAWMPGFLSAICTYLFLLAVMVAGAKLLKYDLKRFVAEFTAIFWISLAGLFVGSFGYIAATSNQRKGFGIGWSLGLTSEAGLVLLLLVGLAFRNRKFFSATAKKPLQAFQADWYIKIGLILLGAYLAVQVAGTNSAAQLGLAKIIVLRGFVAVVVVYLIDWILVYVVVRKFFHLSPEDAAVFATAISICGVAAAVAIGAAVKARPAVIAMVSSLVVLFSVVGEVMVLPPITGEFLYKEPLVAGSFMAMSVKTDGAAVAAGTITEAAIQAKAIAVTGAGYVNGFVLMTTSVMKLEIDLFIGIFAVLLAGIWALRSGGTSGTTIGVGEIWIRFPKFLFGCVITFGTVLLLSLHSPQFFRAAKVVALEANGLRLLFFAMTFFCLGLAVKGKEKDSREESFVKLAVAYAVCLLVIILPASLGAAWMTFHGILPPPR
jgi:uncharacterized membrane protein YadS